MPKGRVFRVFSTKNQKSTREIQSDPILQPSFATEFRGGRFVPKNSFGNFSAATDGTNPDLNIVFLPGFGGLDSGPNLQP